MAYLRLLNRQDWAQIKDYSKFVKTSKRFRPFGTAYHLPVKGKAKVHMTSINGATVESYVYVVDNAHEKSLLGKEDALQLRIITLNPDDAQSEVHSNDVEVMKRISRLKKMRAPTTGVISGGQNQAEIDESM